MDDATIEIVLKWVQQNEQALRDAQAQLAGLTAQTAASAAATNAANAAAFGGIPAWLAWTAAIAGAVVILWPFVMLVGSAAVALVSFAVAGAGFAATGALVAGVFGAIGAAVLFLAGSGSSGAAAALTTATTQLSAAQQALADFNALHPGNLTLSQQQQQEDLTLRVTQAQQKYNDALAASQGPVAVLLSQLSDMRDAWAQQAVPLATVITQWAAGGIPAIQQLGSSIMSWFGDRLPGVLAGLSKIINDLSPAFVAFGQYFGGVMDKIGPLLAPIAEAFARLALQGAKGLLDNLVSLSQWFVKELPTLGPIVQQIFGAIGGAIQWVANNWGTLTDFVQNKWPTTVKNAQDSLAALQDWWKKNGDTVTTFGNNIVTLMGYFNQIIIVWAKLYDFLNGVGLTPTRFLQAIDPILNALGQAADYVGRITGSGGSSSARPSLASPTPGPSPYYQSPRTTNVTINGANVSDPQATSRAVTRALRAGAQV